MGAGIQHTFENCLAITTDPGVLNRFFIQSGKPSGENKGGKGVFQISPPGHFDDR